MLFIFHEFGVLNQSNRCNIFFAELIGAVVKIRPSSVSVTQHALIIAQIKAGFHYKDTILKRKEETHILLIQRT